MKILLTFVVVYLLIGGCYLLALLVSEGTVAEAYVLTLLLVALSACFIRFSMGLMVDDGAAERRREHNGLLALAALALFLGFYRSLAVSPLAYPYFMGLGLTALIISMIAGGIPYLLTLLRDWRPGKLVVLVLVTGTLGFYFQPPLEGVGRLLQLGIDATAWTLAEPNRAYYMTFSYLLAVAVVLSGWVEFYIPRQLRNVHEHTSATAYTRLGRVFARVVMWVTAFAVGLTLVMLRDVFDAASPVTWYVLLQSWLQVLVTIVCGLFMVLAVEPEGRTVNALISVFILAGVLMFAELGPGLTVVQRLLVTASVVMGLSAIAGVYSWRCLHCNAAASEERRASYQGFITCAGIATVLFGLVWVTCPTENHSYPMLALVVFVGMLLAVGWGAYEYHGSWPQVSHKT